MVPVAGGPKPEPLTVTCVFAAPIAVERLVTTGGPGAVTAKGVDTAPPGVATVRVPGPGAALAAMFRVAVIWVGLTTITLVTAIPRLLAVTVEGMAKLVPVKVTETLAPWTPVAGLMDANVGADGMTVNGTALLASPPTVTTTLPVVAPLGTGTTILVAVQLVAIPAPMPLKATVPDPWLAPRLLPVMVTAVPTVPEVGDRLVMLGVAATMLYTDVATLLFVKPLAYATALSVVVALTVTGPL
jgi:hypothetical protein